MRTVRVVCTGLLRHRTEPRAETESDPVGRVRGRHDVNVTLTYRFIPVVVPLRSFFRQMFTISFIKILCRRNLSRSDVGKP